MADIDVLWHLIERGKKGENRGLRCGLPKLEKLLGGIQTNRYYLLAGNTSAGKTSLVLYMLYRLLKDYPDEPIYILYFSLEIGSEILLSKLMALYIAETFGSYLTVNDILSFEEPLTDKDYEYLKKAKEWIKSIDKRLIILDEGLTCRTLYSKTSQVFEKLGTLEKVEGKTRFIPKDPRLKVFGVIDHFSLIRPEEGRTLKQEIDLASSYMVTLKRRYPLSWFALMQHNRNADSVDRRKMDLLEPSLADLKDSGSPSQDSDVVLQLFYPAREKLNTYRDYRVFGPNSFGQILRSCLVNKNRYGLADKVIGMAFYGRAGWFNELPPGKEITDCTKYLDIHRNIFLKDSTVEDTEAKDNKVTFKL